MARMSRTMPPTPVAAPWYGSTKLGWLCDSTLNVTASLSLTWITPAFSPMPASSRSLCGAFSPNWRRCILLDLYEQCSLHMIEYMYSSESVGRRPRIVADLRVLVGAAEARVPRTAASVSGDAGRSRPTVSDRRRGHACASFGIVMPRLPPALLRTEVKKPRPSSGRAGQRLDRVLGVRHDADDVAGLVADRGDVAHRAVRVAADVAGDDPALGLELVERVLVGDVAALAVLDRDARSPGRSRTRSVHGCRAVSTRSRWSRLRKCRCALRTSAPGSRCASHSTWKPLQMPSTGRPPRAASTIDAITGANRAIAPQRR